MEIELSKLLNSSQVLKKISKYQLKAKTAWTLLKLIKKIEEEENSFEEIKTQKVQQYGIHDELTDTYTIDKSSPHYQEVAKELLELLQTKIILPDIKIQFEELENIDFSIEELNYISWIISE